MFATFPINRNRHCGPTKFKYFFIGTCHGVFFHTSGYNIVCFIFRKVDNIHLTVVAVGINLSAIGLGCYTDKETDIHIAFAIARPFVGLLIRIVGIFVRNPGVLFSGPCFVDCRNHHCISANNQKWEGRKDPKIEQTPYTTTKSYFSVLLRVSHKKYGSKIVYPYPIYDKPMRVIYLAVKANNEIICQVYPDSEGRRFYTDEARTQLYTLPAGCEIKDFGWAAIPVEVKWEPGKLYIYKLNYSNGIGLHDPADPDPGTPIVEKNTLGVSLDVIVADWGDYTDETIKVIPDE